MKNKRKSFFYIAVGAIALILILVVAILLPRLKYSSKIPEPDRSTSLSEVVLQQISETTKLARKKPSAENLGTLGMVYHSCASYEKAASCYKLAMERDPEQWKWAYYLGYLSLEMGQSEQVIENFNRVITINPRIYHAWYYCAEAYMKVRSYEKAEQYLKNISGVPRAKPGGETSRIDHFPLGIYAKYQLARVYFDSSRPEEAETTLQEILKEDKLFGPAYRLLGNIARAAGDEETGNLYSLRANELMVVASPVDALVDQLVLLSRSELYVLKKIDEASSTHYSDWALSIIDNALIHMPENRFLIAKAIKTWLLFNLDDKALPYADIYLAFAENTYGELFATGDLFYQKKHYAQALNYFTKLEEMEPGVMETRQKIAISLWHLGEENKALSVLDQILAAYPHNMEVLANITDLMIFELDEKKISADYLKILSHFIPQNPLVLKMKAREAEKNGKISEAIQLYEASFSINPEDIVCINNFGSLLKDQKMWNKAIWLYSEALKYHENYPTLLENLGTLLITCPDPSLRDVPGGIVFAERAFIHSASSPATKIDAGKSLVEAYISLGEDGRARSILQALISISKRYAPEQTPALEKMNELLAQ